MGFYNPSNSVNAVVVSAPQIGGLADFPPSGAVFSDGVLTWLQSGVAAAQSLIPAAYKTILRAGSAASLTTVVINAHAALDNTGHFYANLPIARISGSNISCVPAAVAGSASFVGTITSAGLQYVSTGQNATNTVADATGGLNTVTSDNTSLFCFVASGPNQVLISKSTDGVTWTPVTVTGMATFNMLTGVRVFPSGTLILKTSLGDNLRLNTTDAMMAFYCGARHLVIAAAGGVFIATRSTNGAAWGGDETAAILNNAAIANTAANAYFYRNGNNCFLQIAGMAQGRYTADGGVTWADSSGGPTMATTRRFKRNTTTPAKLAILDSGSSTAYFSANNGQTWTSRTLPTTPSPSGGAAYTGSTIVFVSGVGVMYRSVDDGATWVTAALPAGFASAPQSIASDANRFYCLGSNQILTSADAITWTISNLTSAQTLTVGTGLGISSFSSNNVALTLDSANIGVVTNDGGVTWAFCATDTQSRSSSQVGDAYVTPDGGGYAFTGSGSAAGADTAYQYSIAQADVASLGGLYRTGTTAYTPLRANSFTYARIA